MKQLILPNAESLRPGDVFAEGALAGMQVAEVLHKAFLPFPGVTVQVLHVRDLEGRLVEKSISPGQVAIEAREEVPA